MPSPRPALDPSELSIHNLDAEIGDAWRRMTDKGETFSAQRLPDLLLERAGYLGITEDFDAADEISTKNLAANPNDGGVLLSRAHVLGALHRFDDALRALDAAGTHGAPVDGIARARATIFLATGRCAEAGPLWPALPYSTDMAARGALEQRLGHAAAAETLFERARLQYNDVSPLRFAWINFERARAFEREGGAEASRHAQAYLEDALAIVPEYAHAAVHLAALEPGERAIAHLEAVEKRATDPDVFAAHADALRRLKKDDEARAMTDRARARFEVVLAKHPEAYAFHAAHFFLGAGGDLKRAVVLAKDAATRAPDEESIQLWLLAARASGAADEVCAAVGAADKSTCPPGVSRPDLDSARKTCK